MVKRPARKDGAFLYFRSQKYEVRKKKDQLFLKKLTKSIDLCLSFYYLYYAFVSWLSADVDELFLI
jgi:hypothetical protein